jgi:hypothetical protein
MQAYLGFGLGEKIEQVTISNDQYNAEQPAFSMYGLLEFVCNLTFLVWIYSALGKTQKELVQNSQTLKLKMYQSLAYTLGFFIFIFFILTVVAIVHRTGATVWPWDWRWLMDVGFFDDGAFWSLLNFSVLTAMCVIWRPSPLSSQYALSSQLPSEDDGTELSGLPTTAARSGRRATNGSNLHVDTHKGGDDHDDDEVDVDLFVGDDGTSTTV